MKTRNLLLTDWLIWAIYSISRDYIPLDLYKPVAEIIGYVMRLKRGQATRYTPSRGSQ